MTTYQLYMFAKEDIHGISFEYLTANDWYIEPTILKERFFHCFKPLPTNELKVTKYKLRSTKL